ncbi:MAG: FecR family protein [Flavobacteriaceae bacterium]|nr:FecR family protein [Flavobacteriaceae bacterium]
MAKKNYDTIEDFLIDESFNNWVKATRLTDVDFWEAWIANNPHKKELVYEAKDILLGLQFKHIEPSKEKVDTSWSLLENKIKAKNIEKQKKQSPSSFRLIGIAASILIFVSIGFYMFNEAPKKIIYKTAYGEVLNLKLMDGSLVTLNSNSSIYYYENNNRKVWLTGEAFFKVDKKATTNAKFWVLTDDLNVEVYGTSFNVDTKHQKTAVFLEEGSVWLELKNGTTQKMVPGNFISYSSVDNLILEQQEKVASRFKTSWKDGSIIFEKLPLIEAMQKIEDTYGLTAIFKDVACKAKLITGGIPITNLSICLKAIEKSANVKITKLKNQLIIQKK